MKALKQLGMTAAALVILFSQSAAGERQGATVTIVKKDGAQVTGELLAVKRSALVIMPEGSASLIEESAALQDISSVIVIRKSKTTKGLVLGLLIGGAAGAAVGGAAGSDPPGWFSMTAAQKATALGILCGLAGMAVGGIAGATSGIDSSYEFSQASKAKVQAELNELGQEAKVRGVH